MAPFTAPPEPQIASTAAGDVEYARLGDGPPLLAIHGSPGGCDQGALLARFAVAAGHTVIAPSRPGYMGTPLGDRTTPDDQAGLHVALLDALEIERCGVLFWSGGGPSGYRLAVEHPERVSAIVALDAVSKTDTFADDDVATRLMMATRPGNWLLKVMADHAPKQVVAGTLEAEGSLDKDELRARVAQVMAAEDKRQFVLDLSGTVSYREPRKAGLENDREQFPRIESLELERVRAPTLVVHGSADTDVTPDQGEHAAATIPNAELLTLDGGTHICFYTHPDAEAAQARALEVLAAGS